MNDRFHRIEWDGLHTNWEVEEVKASEHLPPGLAKIVLLRDASYRIKAKMLGTSQPIDEVNDKLLPKLEGVAVRPPISIDGSDSIDTDYHLEQCYVRDVHPYLKSRFPVNHIIGDPRHEYDPYYEANIDVGRAQRSWKTGREIRWLTEWYLNGPKEHAVYRRVTDLGRTETYSRLRRSVDSEAMVLSDGRLPGAAVDFSFVQTADFSFIIHKVPDGRGPVWSDNIGIEYRQEWGVIPDSATREAISEIVSFVIGRHLLKVGYGAFDASGWPVDEVGITPWGTNVIAICDQADSPPVHLAPSWQSGTNIETLLRQLIPPYLALRQELQLSDALWRFWISQDMPLGMEIPVLATGVEILANAWNESGRSKARGTYLPKKGYDKLVAKELATLAEKLVGVEFSDRILRKWQDAYRTSGNERLEFFLSEIPLVIGPEEREAMRARNGMTHGAASYSEEKVVQLLRLQGSYVTLFNRVILKLLGFEGKYIDRSVVGFSEREIDEPLGDRVQNH